MSDSDRRNTAAAGVPQLQLLIDAVVDYAIYMIGLDGRRPVCCARANNGHAAAGANQRDELAPSHM